MERVGSKLVLGQRESELPFKVASAAGRSLPDRLSRCDNWQLGPLNTASQARSGSQHMIIMMSPGLKRCNDIGSDIQ